MSGYVEVMIRGNCRAFLEVNNIAGLVCPPGLGASSVASPEDPISIIMRGGDTLEGVYGVSAMKLMLHIEGVKLLMKDRARLCVVAFRDSIAQFEADIEAAIAAREMARG